MWTEIDDDDLVYFYWGDKSALAIPHIKRHKRNKIFVRFHRTDLYEYARHGYIPFRKNIFSHTDHFLPISNDGKEYLLNHYPSLITPEKTEICRLGVFDRGSNPPQTDKAAFHLLSCSYVVPVKRLPLIIDTLKRISVPLKWTHIGSGPLFKDIQDQAKTLPSNIEVNFKGALTNAEVIRYYQENHIDLFLNVSSSEGIPVSIMEALSFGIPVLATDVGGTREIMDEKTGRLIHVNTSAAEIADQINALIQSDTDALRKNARQRWEERCNAEKNYKDFIKFLKTNQ